MTQALGVMIKELRLRHSENLKQLATLLGVTSSFLSAVEHGKKSLPNQHLTKIVEHYKLTSTEERHLEEARFSDTTLRTSAASGLSESDRMLHAVFARKLPTLSEETKNEIENLLMKR